MWRSRIMWRLFSAYSVLLAVALVLLGWLLIDRLERHHLQEVRRSLETKTVLIGELMARQKADALQGEVSRLGAGIRARITLLAADGTVLADSMESPKNMENHKGRPEVQEADRSGTGVSTRYSGTVHQPMMYLARTNEQGPIRYVRLALPLDTIAAEVSWLRRLVWTGTGITLVLALLLSLVIARRLIAPLVDLAGAAKAVARGDYGQRVRITAADEIGVLADAFNDMSRACAVHIAQMDQDRQQLRAIFSSMVEGVVVLDAEQTIQFVNEAARNLLGPPLENAQGRKIWQIFRHRQLGEALEKIMTSKDPERCELEWSFTERKVFAVHGVRLPGELLAGAVLVFHDITNLRKLERMRQDFVANVSHELKTPLAAIQATVETLLDGALSDPDHNVHFLDRIRENADRLYRLVQDLLTLGRIESGQEALEIQPLAVDMAVAACISRQEDRAKTKGLELKAEPPTENIAVLADDEALAEILDNLVDNAIKYTNSGGRITLRWSTDDGHVVLQVTDSGVGIPEKDLPRIFERFYRVDKARSRELGGTGLGLSIVKHLVQALNGTIAADSQLGHGTTFTVRLPLAQLEDNAPRIRHGIFTNSSQ